MTRKIMLIAGVAGMALTAPASAEKGGRGEDKEQRTEARQGGGKQAQRQEQRAERSQRQERQEQRAERPQRQERQEQRAERPQPMERQMQRAERPQRKEREMRRAERPQRVERQVQRQERQQKAERPQRVERQVQRQERKQRVERQQQRMERQAQRPERRQRVERQAERQERKLQRVERKNEVDRGQQRFERREQIREARQDNRQQQRFERRSAERLFAPRDRDSGDVRTAQFDGRGYRPVAPFFSTRDMRQMKPFKAKFDDRRIVSIGDRFDSSRNWSPVPAIYGRRYFDNNDYYYRYDNDFGYAYQIHRRSNIVSSLFPLFGGYSIGDPWPQTYYSSYVPQGYRSYYYDTPDHFYRNDGYGIYQVDVGTQLITALVSLVMGQGFNVGQALPASYSAYNVPLDYRANYYDSDDSWYRYGDGFIYQMEPDSRRIAARYPLYSDDYYVGQAWPVAYPDYNVPYGYRSAYQDTPQYHYRYANGGIYQVDPTNQLIMALVALVTGDQFAVGQRLPSGYDMYNVPLDYRDRWADSDDDYYRYANGYVYRVDPDSWLIEEAYPVYA